MKIDVTKVLVGFDGKPLIVPGEKGSESLALKTVIVNALVNAGEEKIGGTEKIARYSLAQRVHAATGDIDLSAEEVAKVKALVDSTYPSPLVVAQAWLILDPPGETKAKKSKD